MKITHFVFVCAGLVGSSFSARAAAQSAPFDNQAGQSLNFERAQLEPLAFSADGSRLFTINTPGSRVVAFDVATDTRVLDIPVGIGATSLARRPGTDEIWVVDTIASTVSILQPATANIVHSIRVGGQPRGLAFTPTGDRAYVTCAGVRRVDVIDAATRSVVKSIPVPVVEPRGILWHAGFAWIVPFLSGNGTAPVGTAADSQAVVGIDKIPQVGFHLLPDRDLISIQTQADPQQDAVVPLLQKRGLGTVLYSIALRPGSNELWVPNTEALNAQFKGEANFVAGQVVSNRITVVVAGSSAAPKILDLDALAPPDQKLAQPTYVAFDASGSRAFVCGFGTDLIGVLDLPHNSAPVWRGSIFLPSIQLYPRGTGPRAAVVSPNGQKLYVYDRDDNALSIIDLTALPNSGTFALTANKPVSLGFETVSDEERLGRFLFNNARFSKSMASSCSSCHIDGHVDGIAWDLSAFLDPEGTPSSQLSFGMDVKGPMVTQSTLRMQEVGPYHWRGERKSTNDFQVAFPNLLENQVNGANDKIGGEFQYLRHYINHLTVLPNPRENLDRSFTAAQQTGENLFRNKPVLGNLTCSSCHQLPLGTSGEIVTQTVKGVVHSVDVPYLRMVGDKSMPTLMVGGKFGERPELGAGFTHGGGVARLRDAVFHGGPGGSPFNLTPAEADAITEYLLAFDTGVAPAAGYIATANATNVATFQTSELAFLESQADAGHCDLVFYRSPRKLPGGKLLYLNGRYNPATHKYTVAAAGAPETTAAAVLADVTVGRPVTFVGAPVGMGLQMALDRDLDGLLDYDEFRKGLDPENVDVDKDGFYDGYEVLWGMNPKAPNSSSPDHIAPALAGPVTLHWANQRTLKFEFDTTEACRVLVSYNGGIPKQRLPLGPPDYASHFDIVLEDLEPGTHYDVAFNLTDMAGNSADDQSFSASTSARVFGDPAYVANIVMTVQGTTSPILRVQTELQAADLPAGAGYVVRGSVYRILSSGSLVKLADGAQATSASDGWATIQVPLPPAGLPSSLVFVVQDVQAPAGSQPWILAENVKSSAAIVY